MNADAAEQPATLAALAVFFLRLGTLAFGGPAAHIAMMEDEVVRRRQWLTPAHFLDLLGGSNLIPGPSSTELAIHIGRVKGGWPGLLIGGLCFVLPAALIVALIAHVYVQYSGLPQIGAALSGIKPVIIAVVAQALWRLGPTAIKSRGLAALALAAAALSFAGVDLIVVLFGAGLVYALAGQWQARSKGAAGSIWLGLAPGTLPFLPQAAAPAAAAAAGLVGLGSLFVTFLKFGAVVYGSGYTLIAFLRADLVDRLHWLTESQLLDAIAVGQVTPGPVFTTATFIGYLVAGPSGALVATLGIFAPAFIFVAATAPFLRKLRASPGLRRFLDGVNVAALALMAVALVMLARASLVDVPSLAIGLVSAAMLLRTRINSAWLVVAGGVAGTVLH